jgi:hypothetical protein
VETGDGELLRDEVKNKKRILTVRRLALVCALLYSAVKSTGHAASNEVKDYHYASYCKDWLPIDLKTLFHINRVFNVDREGEVRAFRCLRQ